MDTVVDCATLKVSELKRQLQERGLDTKGVKRALQARLQKAVDAEAAEAPVEAETTGMDVEMNAGVFDEAATYKGKVKYFRNSVHCLVTPEVDLSSLGLKGKCVKISASEIQSTQSPAILMKEQEVEFKLRKDEFGVYGHSLTGPNGSLIGAPEGYEKRAQPERTLANEGKIYTGKVKNYLWAQGFGYITLDEPDAFEAPEIPDSKAKKKFEKNKELWFCRDDIISTDSAVGVDKDVAVRFQVYTDEKGIGAQTVRPAVGTNFSGVKWELKRGPKPKRKNNKKKNKKGQKRTANQAFSMMQGFQMSGAQIVMMNGVPFMMMPMGGPIKKRKKNKKKKNKNKKNKNAQQDATLDSITTSL